MKRKKSGSREKLSDMLKSVNPIKNSSVYMESNRELSVFRCKGLLEYSDKCVNLRLSDGVLSVSGSALGLETFSNTEITVCGKIEKIEFKECTADE